MQLFDYAFCGDYESKIKMLSRMTKEKWSFGNKNDNAILCNYIKHTFEKIYDEAKLFENEKYSVFNTGLFDEYYVPIYGYFELNLSQDRQKWYLKSFLNEYQMSKIGITNLPERANYFNNLENMVFDINLTIVPQYDHIFSDYDNCNRFPDGFNENPMKQQIFDGSLKTTKNMLAANYKIAIPQYYKGNIQLLVPVCLVNPTKPDLALACEKTKDGLKYIGSTCLTLDMAYNNARLIARPESNWLIP